jgi:hypothetical protein
MGNGGSFSWGQSGWKMKMTTHLHIVPMFRMSATTLLLPVSAFMACQVNLTFFTQVLELEHLVTCNRNFKHTGTPQQVVLWKKFHST